MRWLLLFLVLSVVAVGCYDPVALEEARSSRARAQAELVRHEQETARFEVLAKAGKPIYWPFLVSLLVVLLVVYMNHRAMLAQVAMLTGQNPGQVRLLPGDAGFERALFSMARERGVRPQRDRRGNYYIEGERVRALIEE